MTAISLALALISRVWHEPIVIKQTSVMKLVVYVMCDNKPHLRVQLGFSTILQVASFITAYRGRNLPSIYNDSMSLVYASFACIMSFVVMFTLQPFTKEDPFMPRSIMRLTLSLCANVYVLLCYGKKLYIILFKKEKNTRNYIQSKTFAAIQTCLDCGVCCCIGLSSMVQISGRSCEIMVNCTVYCS